MSMHAIAYFNGNNDTSNPVFDTCCTVQVFLIDHFYELDHPFISVAIPRPKLSIELHKIAERAAKNKPS
jgi:hypothetical protein